MKVIIDISEGDYEMLKVLKSCGGRLHKSDLRILDGTPLPERHGRLIDAGKFVDVLNNAQIEDSDTYKGLGRAKELLVEASTIVEATEGA